MMSSISHDLLATCWTSAGNLAPRTSAASPVDFEQRVQWIAETGWIGMGLARNDLLAIRDQLGYPKARQILDAWGIQEFEVEFLTNWWESGQVREDSDQMRRELFEAAAELGASVVKIAPDLVGTPVDHSRFVDEFGKLCEQGATVGLRIGLEPIPFSNLATIEQGVEVIQAVGHPNGGLVIDVWHCYRSSTSPKDLERLLTPEIVFVMELDDGGQDIVGDLRNDTVHHRLLPGDGVFDVPEYIAAMHRLGFRGHWGVEIISAQHRVRPPKEALADAARRSWEAIDNAETLLKSHTSTD